MDAALSTVVDTMSFTECPRWHEGRLWFSDFYIGQVFSVREDGSDLRVEAEVPGQPSGLGWLPDGRLLVVSMHDQRVLRRETDGSLVTHADLSGVAMGHTNDMCVDAEGGAYVGCFGFDLMGGADCQLAPLIRVAPDGTVSVAAEEMAFPNGMVITDGTLLVNETIANRVTAFDIAEDGSLSNRRAWATFGETPVGSNVEELMPQIVLAPDGSALDASGGLWVADAVGGRAVRVVDGEIVNEVAAGTGVFACAVGGSDGSTLFLCTAPDFFEHLRAPAREGAVLAIRIDVA